MLRPLCRFREINFACLWKPCSLSGVECLKKSWLILSGRISGKWNIALLFRIPHFLCSEKPEKVRIPPQFLYFIYHAIVFLELFQDMNINSSHSCRTFTFPMTHTSRTPLSALVSGGFYEWVINMSKQKVINQWSENSNVKGLGKSPGFAR